MYISHLR